MLAFIKPFLPALKWVAIGAGGLLILWFLWGKIETHFKNYNTLIANQAKLQAAEASNLEVIKALNNNIDILQQANREKSEAVARQQQVIEKANEYRDDVEEILSQHRVDKLMAAKPGLMEGVYNRGTADYFRMLEQRTAELTTYFGSARSDVSSPIRISPAPQTEPSAR